MVKGLSGQEREGARAVRLARSAESRAALATLLTVHSGRSELLGRVAVRLLRSAERRADRSHRLGAPRLHPRVGREQRSQPVDKPTVSTGHRLART